MEGLTKKSVKVRLLISFLLAIIWTIIMYSLGGFKGSSALLVILSPMLMTWSISVYLFFPKEIIKNVILPYFVMWIHFLSLNLGKGIKDIFQPLVWQIKGLIRSIKVIIWAFSSDTSIDEEQELAC